MSVKIEFLKDVEVETVLDEKDESGCVTRSRESQMFFKGSVSNVTILKVKKGSAEIQFSDGSVGKIETNTYKMV